MKALNRFGSAAALTLAVLAVISLTGCGGVTYKTYTNDKFKFSLEYPSDMVVKNENKVEGSFIGGVDLENKDYIAGVNVKEVGDRSLSSVAEEVNNNMPEATNLKEEKTTLGGQPAIQKSFNSMLVGTKVFTEEVFTVKDGKRYFLSVSPLLEENYSKATDPFNKMKESFKFL